MTPLMSVPITMLIKSLEWATGVRQLKKYAIPKKHMVSYANINSITITYM